MAKIFCVLYDSFSLKLAGSVKLSWLNVEPQRSTTLAFTFCPPPNSTSALTATAATATGSIALAAASGWVGVGVGWPSGPCEDAARPSAPPPRWKEAQPLSHALTSD